MKKIIKWFAIFVLIILLLYIFVTVGGTYKYLKEYGFGINELPGTLAVHYGLSDGFTVRIEDDTSVFIGHHDYIYDNIFEKHGYYQCDRMGLVGEYNKSGSYKDKTDFEVVSSDDWCHWFRVYYITNDFKIEDFLN